VRLDVLVLGGGAAGCVLAALSETEERSVCLVEAGPDYGHLDEGRWPADLLDARWLALESHCWERDDEDDRSQLRARVIGGCSAHNACVLSRARAPTTSGVAAGRTTPFGPTCAERPRRCRRT
jgi:choline dehydrogenase-like flavoprotein